MRLESFVECVMGKQAAEKKKKDEKASLVLRLRGDSGRSHLLCA